MTISSSTDSLVALAAVGGGVALVVTTLAVPVTVGLARRWGIVDEPGARSSHTVDTPRLGGLGVGAGALVGLAAAVLIDPSALDIAGTSGLQLAVALGATALLFGLIGVVDDLLRGIPVSVRLVAQIVVGLASAGLWVGAVRNDETSSASTAVFVASIAIAAIWLIGYVNAFNFMDGIDGISGFVALVVGADLAFVGAVDERGVLVVAGVVLIGAAVGFLRLNLRPANVFLGDGGSYFLGGWIAMAAVIGIGLDTPPEAVLAVTAPYLADTASTLVRRLIGGADWRASHHEHAYQQLIDLGYSHRAVALSVAGASALCAAFGAASLFVGPAARVVAMVAVVSVSALYVVSPIICRRRSPTGETLGSSAAGH